jgi:alpha/beta superfamily hydrolase
LGNEKIINMNSKKITFLNSAGNELAAKIEFPGSSTPLGFALFAHCFTCNKNLTAATTIGRALTANGIAVLRFDFTGLGESEGEFENTNFSSNVEDLISAARYLEQNYKAPSIIIGHSLGGAAVIFAASELDSVKAIVTIGAPSSPKHVSHLFKNGMDEIEQYGEAIVSIGGREFKIKKQFLDDLKEKSLEGIVKKMKKAMLVMHSPQDTTVGIENAAEIFKAAWHPKSFISLDGADHLLSRKEDSAYVGQIIAAWSARYIS